jgi:hypothetical protein
LRLIITQLYKAVPKAIKEENDIDSILKDPDSLTQSKSKTGREELPDIKLLQEETERFIKNAYNQNYFIPNKFVSKRDRPKWRFIVKRLYKDVLAVAGKTENLPLAAQLLEELYQLLCHSCHYTLFNAYDPFQSMGIEQEEFFRRVLALKFQIEDIDTVIKNTLLMLINNPLNRYTLHENLMEVILEFLKTPDLREKGISKCNELLEALKREPPSKDADYNYTYKYEKQEKLNNLTEMGFLCYAQLYEYDKAISFYKKNYAEDDSEIALYILLRLLFSLNQKDYFLQEYEKALTNGITPRQSLKKMYRSIKESGKLPEYFD